VAVGVTGSTIFSLNVYGIDEPVNVLNVLLRKFISMGKAKSEVGAIHGEESWWLFGLLTKF